MTDFLVLFIQIAQRQKTVRVRALQQDFRARDQPYPAPVGIRNGYTKRVYKTEFRVKKTGHRFEHFWEDNL